MLKREKELIKNRALGIFLNEMNRDIVQRNRRLPASEKERLYNAEDIMNQYPQLIKFKDNVDIEKVPAETKNFRYFEISGLDDIIEAYSNTGGYDFDGENTMQAITHVTDYIRQGDRLSIRKSFEGKSMIVNEYKKIGDWETYDAPTKMTVFGGTTGKLMKAYETIVSRGLTGLLTDDMIEKFEKLKRGNLTRKEKSAIERYLKENHKAIFNTMAGSSTANEYSTEEINKGGTDVWI